MTKWFKGLGLLALLLAFLTPGVADASHITLEDFLTVDDPDGVLFYEFCVIEGDGLPNSSASDLDTLDFLLAVYTNDTLDTVYFEFVNRSSNSSNISEIYFDDSGAPDSIANGSVFATLGTVNFTVGGVSPPDLPAGNNLDPDFNANRDISAEADGNTADGLNSGENLVLAYDIIDLGGFAEALLNNTFRIGMHVRSIGQGGQSDAFIAKPLELPPPPNTPQDPVPEPSTLLLLGMGSSFLVMRKRLGGLA